MRVCQESVSSHEFSEWIAFSRLQPFGEQRMDYRFAMLAALVSNLWTDGKKKRWKPEEFMPDFEKAMDEVENAPAPVTVVDKVKNFFGMLVGASKADPAQRK